MREVSLGPVSDFPESGRLTVDIDGTEVGIFRLEDGFVAYLNACAHMGGPVCLGKIIPRVEELFGDDQTSLGFRFSKDRKNIVCPWHGYEFHLSDGYHVADRRLRLQKFDVIERDGEVYVAV